LSNEHHAQNYNPGKTYYFLTSEEHNDMINIITQKS